MEPKYKAGQVLKSRELGLVNILEVLENHGGFGVHYYLVQPHLRTVKLVRESSLVPGQESWWVICKRELYLIAGSLVLALVVVLLLR